MCILASLKGGEDDGPNHFQTRLLATRNFSSRTILIVHTDGTHVVAEFIERQTVLESQPIFRDNL